MHRGRKIVLAVAVALVVLLARPILASDDSEQVLRTLDVAAANFHSTSADFEFDSIQTDPVPDKDVQKGVVYYERKGDIFQMGVHIREVNGKVVPKVLT